MKIYLSIGLMFLIVVLHSCDKKKDTELQTQQQPCEASYTKNVKAVVDAKCALPSCHGDGSSQVDFTEYSNLKDRADNGRIKQYVFELKIMPPANATPLTDQEKEILNCWLDNGAPE